jgi:hypothetical protein
MSVVAAEPLDQNARRGGGDRASVARRGSRIEEGANDSVGTINESGEEHETEGE